MWTSQRTSTKYPVFDGVTTGITNSVSKAYLAEDFRNAVVQITTTATCDMIVKFPWSNLSNYETTTLNDAYPDFSATNSMANPWDYLQFVDLNTGTPYVGSTGFHLSTAGTAATYEFEVNVNYKRWMGVEISSRASGGIKTTITFTDNR